MGPLRTAAPMVQLTPVTRAQAPAPVQAAPVQRAAAVGPAVQRVPPPSLGAVMTLRIRQVMPQHAPYYDVNDVQDVRDFIMLMGHHAGVPIAVQQAVTNAPVPADIQALEAVIAGALAGQTAQGGQYRNESAYKRILGPVLRQNAYIQSIMTGAIQGAPPPLNASLAVNTANPSNRTTSAVGLFNKLVNRAGLPAIDENRTWSPASAMGGSVLSLGWASPSGVVLHELGHHLEDNLNPDEFTTLHNFLRARSRQRGGAIADMRSVGYSTLVGRPSNETGYDIEAPKIRTGRNNKSLKGLVWSGIKFLAGRLFGQDWGAREIEDFFIGHANNRQVGYNTQVYDGWHSTEYLSTTIEMLNRPDSAKELIGKDPLRVALFLYTGNRPVYNVVAAAFANDLAVYNQNNPPLPVVTLDQLIHTV